MQEAAQLLNFEDAVALGGGSVKPASISGNSKADAEVLLELKELGFLEEVGKKRFSITKKGWDEWKKQADRESCEQAIRSGVEKLLIVVDDRGGAALTKSQKQSFCLPLIEESIGRNLLERTSKADAYTLTTTGEEFVLARLSPEERPKKQRQWMTRDETLITALLQTIEKKPNKPLTKTETAKFSKVLESLQSKELIEPGDKNGAYRLTRAGKEWQLSRLSDEERRQRFEQLKADYQSLVGGLQKRVAKQADLIGGDLKPKLESAAKELQAAANEAMEEFCSRVNEFESLDRFSDLIEKGKEQIMNQATKSMQKVANANAELFQREDKVRFEITCVESQLADALRNMEEDLSMFGDSCSHPPKSQQSDLFDAVKSAYGDIYTRNRRFSTNVKIPELHDELDSHGIHLSRKSYHQLLLDLQNEGKISLQVCNDPDLESRASEGISSSRGLLFYVHIRSAI